MQKSGKITRYSSQEIIGIVLEARKPNVREAQVCRRHGITPGMFRFWERLYPDGSSQLTRMGGISDTNGEGVIEETEIVQTMAQS